MRPIALMPLLLACAACTDQAPPTLVGHYVRQPLTARDPSWRGIIGEWHQEYRADGHLIVHGAGGTEVDSLYRLDGDILTLNDVAGSGACRAFGIDSGSARCRVHFAGDSVRFDVLQDECIGRRSVVTTHELRRVP